MATRIPEAQKQQILAVLESDRRGNFTLLQFYLKEILRGNPVKFSLREGIVTLPAQDAWSIISEWGRSESGGLPIGDRGSVQTLASRLLNYVDKIASQSAEAAASYYAILEEARNPIVPEASPVQDPASVALRDTFKLRRQIIDALNKKFLGQLTNDLEKTRFLRKITDDRTRWMVATILAADSPNLRGLTPKELEQLPDEIEKLPDKVNEALLTHAGDGKINVAIHSAYSAAAEDELKEVADVVNAHIKSSYESDGEYLSDMAKLRSVSSLAPTFSNLDAMVAAVIPSTPASERAALVSSLRKTITEAARGQHQSGTTLLASALKRAGLSDTTSGALSTLAPYLEEMRSVNQRQLLGTAMTDRNSRELATAGLAAAAGVSLEIPWLSQKDLEAVTGHVLSGTGTNDPLVAYRAELAKGEGANLTLLGNLNQLLHTRADFMRYHDALTRNPRLAAQHALAKVGTSLNSISQPYDRFLGGLWKTYDRIDNIINWPSKTIINGWERAVEAVSIPLGKSGIRFSFLNPASLVLNQWTNLQKGIALNTFKWSNKLAISGRWYSGGFRQVADMSRSFFKADASWGRAGFLFAERKWGNVLNWTAQRIGQESWGALKKTTWEAVAKGAQSIGNKIAAGLGDKIVTALGAATSETGVGLVLLGLQVAWDVGVSVLKKAGGFISSIWNGNADNLFGVVPIALGGLFLTINAALAGVPMMLMGAWEILKALGKMLWDGLVTIFVLAFGIALGGIAVMTLLFYIFKTTVNLDAAPGDLGGMIAAAVCDQTGSATGGSPAANDAACIVQYLSQCHLNPLFANMVNGNDWKCLIAAAARPDVVAQLASSAIGNGWLQCVGFVAATATFVGKPITIMNACSYVGANIAGYRYVSGTSGISSGDFFVIGSSSCSASSPGHIGVVCGEDGALLTACDANYTASGIVRADGKIDLSKITGYLKPN